MTLPAIPPISWVAKRCQINCQSSHRKLWQEQEAEFRFVKIQVEPHPTTGPCHLKLSLQQRAGMLRDKGSAILKTGSRYPYEKSDFPKVICSCWQNHRQKWTQNYRNLCLQGSPSLIYRILKLRATYYQKNKPLKFFLFFWWGRKQQLNRQLMIIRTYSEQYFSFAAQALRRHLLAKLEAEVAE